MTDWELTFNIDYSIEVERLTYQFWRRITILVLASVVVAAILGILVVNPWITIPIQILLVAYAWFTSPNDKARLAKDQYESYVQLKIDIRNNQLNVEQKQQLFVDLQTRDSKELSFITFPSYIISLDHKGFTNSNIEQPERKLKISEKLIMLFLGEKIRYKF